MDGMTYKGVPINWDSPENKPDIILVAPWVLRELRRIHQESERLVRLKRELRALRRKVAP